MATERSASPCWLLTVGNGGEGLGTGACNCNGFVVEFVIIRGPGAGVRNDCAAQSHVELRTMQLNVEGPTAHPRPAMPIRVPWGGGFLPAHAPAEAPHAFRGRSMANSPPLPAARDPLVGPNGRGAWFQPIWPTRLSPLRKYSSRTGSRGKPCVGISTMRQFS